jgi:DNA-binding GntR family transcriptional regulator
MTLKPGKQIWQAIAEEIKENIISGRYKPLDRLKEADLATKYLVSKTPIREALRHLESVGFVEVVPHTMVIVKKVEAKEAMNLFSIQSVLEGLAARQAIPNLDEDHLRSLKRHAALIDRHRNADNAPEYEKANFNFHFTLWKASKNENLFALLNSIHEQIQRYRAITRRYRGQFKRIVPGHTEILEALIQGDEEKSEQLLRRHVEWYGKAIVSLMESENSG